MRQQIPGWKSHLTMSPFAYYPNLRQNLCPYAGVSSLRKEVAMLKKLSVLVLLLSSVTMAHDMWLEPDRFVFGTGDLIAIRNGNGTIYQKTENAVLPDRITSLFGIGPDGQKITVGDPVAEDKWTRFNFAAKRAGNYWVAMGTRPRMIRLSGKDFTEYLEHDGIPEVLKERAEKGISDRDEIEQMLDEIREDDYPIRSMIHQVVQSDLFRNK